MEHEESIRKPYDIELTDEALYGYADVKPDSVYERIGSMFDMLGSFPLYGQVYDPYYEASRPELPCRVFYCGHYGIYYHVDKAASKIIVIAIVDERKDPRTRFKIVTQ